MFCFSFACYSISFLMKQGAQCAQEVPGHFQCLSGGDCHGPNLAVPAVDFAADGGKKD